MLEITKQKYGEFWLPKLFITERRIPSRITKIVPTTRTAFFFPSKQVKHRLSGIFMVSQIKLFMSTRK